ncbi:acetyl-CoA acetyltransferase [Cytobacillus horneckiae]|uniref:propanoyl-CoA C-acyltransferase n=1 Tax=Cytobacillus horneckiae TaxID=549687 RepID=A0A2N0ZL13_9BACI|nr:lipid-transfer protein [Cytobacillus horneckiae]MBN6885586.1 lipid-transfer protein [Cytobacillus horneckiae]MCM3180448.1 lipid-transfer protein [Cytobacillus horneckiae]MEC1156303.1 lipid-transfer protein [Cytobacillus horneckiae]MED2938321.1 lipid-transfer protein [Cytobacillus horneckiae]PKG30166.1 lipid-transfer protein [Cytobacillus horneckiae]
MSKKVKVIGVNMMPFTKPGTHEPYEVMAARAVKGALEDAGINYSEIQQAYASYVYGDSTCGQRALYMVGMTGIPTINVHNNCSSGSTALFLARQAVEFGSVECALAVGFEEMQPGALKSHWNDRTSALGWAEDRLKELWPEVPEVPRAIRLFGAATKEYLEKYGVNPDIFAKISVKSRNHATNNPYSLFRKPLTVEEVLNSPMLMPDMTRLMACPPTCGAAAAIVCSEEFAKKHGISNAVEIVAQALTTDMNESNDNIINLVGADMTRRASKQVYEAAGIGPDEVDVLELHDCFTPAEVITYEGLDLCEEGGAEKLINDGDNTYGGKYVVNPSGGLMSKGHPIGATGLAQCTELVWQLRGQAQKRQVENARVALQHNLGLGGACVVTMYRVG